MTEREPPSDGEIASVLQAVQAGDRQAVDRLFSLVYEPLRSLARRQRHRWRGNLTLNTTAIAHEAYLKLVDGGADAPRSQEHFYALAAKAMRHILCNYARDRLRLKRGGGAEHVPIDETIHVLAIDMADQQADELAALDEALRRLERLSERQGQVVECRFFAGMSIDETAAALQVSPATVKRDWAMASAWLHKELAKS